MKKLIFACIILFLILAFAVVNNVLFQDGDDKYPEQAKKCEPLENAKGFISVKTIAGNIELKLPHFADVRRDVGRGCEYTKFISLDYLWHEGRLVPQYEFGNNVAKDKYMPVRIYYRNSCQLLTLVVCLHLAGLSWFGFVMRC